MNILSFKEGDIITRNEPITHKHNGSVDSSYCGNRLIFMGLDPVAKIIFLTQEDDILLSGDVLDLSYARDAWDEGWTYYPETLLQKIKNKIKKD